MAFSGIQNGKKDLKMFLYSSNYLNFEFFKMYYSLFLLFSTLSKMETSYNLLTNSSIIKLCFSSINPEKQSVDAMPGSEKGFVLTEEQTHGSVHSIVYLCSESRVIPLGYPGAPT